MLVMIAIQIIFLLLTLVFVGSAIACLYILLSKKMCNSKPDIIFGIFGFLFFTCGSVIIGSDFLSVLKM